MDHGRQEPGLLKSLARLMSDPERQRNKAVPKFLICYLGDKTGKTTRVYRVEDVFSWSIRRPWQISPRPRRALGLLPLLCALTRDSSPVSEVIAVPQGASC